MTESPSEDDDGEMSDLDHAYEALYHVDQIDPEDYSSITATLISKTQGVVDDLATQLQHESESR